MRLGTSPAHAQPQRHHRELERQLCRGQRRWSDHSYSYRNAAIGATLDARCAGTYAATRKTINSADAAASSTNGSTPDTPKSSALAARASGMLTAAPATMPITLMP